MRKILTLTMTAIILAGLLSGCRVNISGEPVSKKTGKETKTQETQPAVTGIEEKETPIFVDSMENSNTVNLYFVNGGEIPYIEIEDCAEIQKWVTYYFGMGMDKDGKKYDLTVERNGDTAKVTREDGYYMTVDCKNDTIDFLDYNAFLRAGDESLLDPATNSAFVLENGVEYFVRRSDETNTRFGSELIMEPGKYGIDLIRDGDSYYLPLQMVSDILLAPRNLNILYNGENIYVIPGGYIGNTSSGLNDMGESYYSAEASGTISPELSEFSYNEFCFAFDQLYGLKEVHGIESFDSLASDSGYKHILTGTDAVAIDKAYYDIIYKYLDDKHSKYGSPSYLAGADAAKDFGKDIGEGFARNEMNSLLAQLADVREKYYPDGIPAYEEVGDTAYITFDSFAGATRDYYKDPPDADASDTIGIISYSVGQILRDDSPVKRVVLDLSRNTGGSSETAAYTLAAFLGKAQISVENMTTGARETCVFYADTNLDHEFDESDTLDGKGLKFYCLTSPVSFSCGNLVPCFFKDSGKVSILGRQSGGGSCASMYMTTAGGSLLRLSNYNRLSFLKNGAFYDIDQGAPVDFTIEDYDHFYDRQALNEFLDTLF